MGNKTPFVPSGNFSGKDVTYKQNVITTSDTCSEGKQGTLGEEQGYLLQGFKDAGARASLRHREVCFDPGTLGNTGMGGRAGCTFTKNILVQSALFL